MKNSLAINLFKRQMLTNKQKLITSLAVKAWSCNKSLAFEQFVNGQSIIDLIIN